MEFVTHEDAVAAMSKDKNHMRECRVPWRCCSARLEQGCGQQLHPQAFPVHHMADSLVCALLSAPCKELCVSASALGNKTQTEAPFASCRASIY